MRSIIISITLLIFFNLTDSKPKIGQRCPEKEKLEIEFKDLCINIKCKSTKLYSTNFTYESGSGIEGLHYKFHVLGLCPEDEECPRGHMKSHHKFRGRDKMFPRCCEKGFCINTTNILQNLQIDDSNSDLDNDD